MSDILIRCMEMPKDCQSCRFCFGDICLALKDQETGDCPLIEIPPHGRLIDADELRASIRESIEECRKWADEVDKDTMMYARISQSVGTFVECSLRAKAAPAVIPAEEVYGQYTDTAGNFHWTGTHSGAHIIKAEEGGI